MLAFGVGGCAIVDNYSGRAVDFNREAEQAQEQVLLLNVIRASLRRPMQFTSLQSVTGSGSASGSVQAGGVATRQTPFLSLFGLIPATTNAAISRLATGTASGNASLSGSATFTVPVLDTQEFYQGILAPIPLQAFDYYLQQGFPPQLLFDLFVLRVEITRLDDGSCRKFTFNNAVRNDLQFEQFQAFVDYLIGSGFSAERVTMTTPYGPPIPQPSAVATAGETAQVVEAFSKASAAGLEIRRESKGKNEAIRLQKKNSLFRFCFAHPGGVPSDWIGRPNSAMFCGNFARRASAAMQRASDGGALEGRGECVPRQRVRRAAASRTESAGEGEDEGARDFDSSSQGVQDGGVSEFRGIRLAPEFLRRIDRLQRERGASSADDFDVNAFSNGVVSFKVYTRSVQGILYYLGEITRRRLFTEFGDTARTIQVKTSHRYGTFPLSECRDAENGGSWQEKNDLVSLSRRRSGAIGGGRYFCENLFVLDNTATGEHVIGVSYDGMHFGIPRDGNRAGRTLQVLELVKQLLALNTSAKQLPTTSVFSVVAP